MEALAELCDIIAQNPSQFSEKLSWICGRCPQPELLNGEFPRVSRTQLNAVLAVSRIISRSPDSVDNWAKSVVIEFLRAVPASFRTSFWPQSFSVDSITSFFTDFLMYVSKSADLSPDFADEIAGFMGEVVLAAINNGSNCGDLTISRDFLLALSQNFPPLLPSDADKLITILLDQFTAIPVASSPRKQPQQPQISISSETSSSQSSPWSVNHFPPGNEGSSPGNEAASHLSSASSKGSMSTVLNGGSILGKSGMDQLTPGLSDGSGASGALFRQQVASFEEESVESLEKQEIAFKLIAHILDKVQIDPKLLEQVRFTAKRQLQSMSAFLKVS